MTITITMNFFPILNTLDWLDMMLFKKSEKG
jgi:hypothetical protein